MRLQAHNAKDQEPITDHRSGGVSTGLSRDPCGARAGGEMDGVCWVGGSHGGGGDVLSGPGKREKKNTQRENVCGILWQANPSVHPSVPPSPRAVHRAARHKPILTSRRHSMKRCWHFKLKRTTKTCVCSWEVKGESKKRSLSLSPIVHCWTFLCFWIINVKLLNEQFSVKYKKVCYFSLKNAFPERLFPTGCAHPGLRECDVDLDNVWGALALAPTEPDGSVFFSKAFTPLNTSAFEVLLLNREFI